MIPKSSPLKVLAVSALMLLPLGCEQIVLRTEFDPVKQELATLRQDLRQFEARYEEARGGGQEAQTAMMKKLQDARTTIESVRKAQADLETRLEEVQRESERLTGLFEEGSHLAQKSSREVEELKKKVDSELEGLKKELKALKARLAEGRPSAPRKEAEKARTPPTKAPARARAPAPKPKEPKAPPPKPELQARAPAETPLTEELEYQQALDTLRKGRKFALARRMLEKFIEKYPNSDLADNAQYWIGETFYVNNKYERAILAFAEVVEKYRKGDKVPDAILKQALSFSALGDKQAARDLLKQLISRFPASPAAELAKKRLQGL